MSVSLLPAALFAVSSAALFAAHQVGNHWIQTHGQAMAKGGSGWSARAACALDQSWHHLFLFIAALILAGGAR